MWAFMWCVTVVKDAHFLNGCEWKAQPKLVTCRGCFAIFLIYLFIYFCWCFNGLIFLPGLVYIRHNILCYILHFSHCRIQKSFSKAPVYQYTLQTVDPQQSMVAAVGRGFSKHPLDLWAPHNSRRTVSQPTFRCEGQIVNRPVSQELCFSARPIQSCESEIGAVSALKVQTPGQKLLLPVRTDT